MVVPVQTSPVLHVGPPAMLFETHAGDWAGVTPDGRFLTYGRRAMVGPPELHVVLNWFEELERLAPHPQR